MNSFLNPMENKLQELFERCDQEGTGVIERHQLRLLCATFRISEEDADAIFKDLDHDADDIISLADFCHGFKDFLTPGSRRGSLQLPLDHVEQLEEMERRHQEAKKAWKEFSNNVGITKLQGGGGGGLKGITEEDGGGSLEKALAILISDVKSLNEDYRSLENSFRKEREVHTAQLTALGEELDQQLAKTEARAKAEARAEAAKQMETERRKIAKDMETQLAELSTQLLTFNKVEEWLGEEWAKRGGVTGDEKKLEEAKCENRRLESALVEAQMKATILQSQLSQKRSEYQDLYQNLHSEKEEYKSQVDNLHSHLSVLSEANRVLSDANDCFMATSGPSSHSSLSPAENNNNLDKDSGRSTLKEEMGGGGDDVVWKQGVERTFKVILAGEAGVGKTTFIERVCHGHFTPNLSSTIGVDFRVKSLELEGIRVTLQLWDTAGQERFRSLTKSYFRRADGVILLYDLTNEKSFLNIRHWVQCVQESAARSLPIVLCGNKKDLWPLAVSTEEGAALAFQCGPALFLETSPKTGENVLEALVLLAREMSNSEDLELVSSLKLSEEGNKKWSCCS